MPGAGEPSAFTRQHGLALVFFSFFNQPCLLEETRGESQLLTADLLPPFLSISLLPTKTLISF